MSQLTYLDLALGLPEHFQKLFDGRSSLRNAAFWLTNKGVILQVAKQHGILLDPIYTLAAWEAASARGVQADCTALPKDFLKAFEAWTLDGISALSTLPVARNDKLATW